MNADLGFVNMSRQKHGQGWIDGNLYIFTIGEERVLAPGLHVFFLKREFWPAAQRSCRIGTGIPAEGLW